jgi:flagellar motor switch protein FliG
MGISFFLIWLATTFFIVRYIKIIKNDLFKKFSDTEKPSEEKSEYISERIVYKPFDYIKGVDPKNLLNFVHKEHPQVIALVLAHLEPKKASVILQNLPSEIQGEVSRRIAILDMVSPEVIRGIEQVLKKKLSTLSSEAYSVPGGVESIVEVLKYVDLDSKNHIIKELEDEDPELAEVVNEFMTKKKFCRKKGIAIKFGESNVKV